MYIGHIWHIGTHMLWPHRDHFAEKGDCVPLVLMAYEKREMYPAQVFFEEMLKYFHQKVLFQGKCQWERISILEFKRTFGGAH